MYSFKIYYLSLKDAFSKYDDNKDGIIHSQLLDHVINSWYRPSPDSIHRMLTLVIDSISVRKPFPKFIKSMHNTATSLQHVDTDTNHLDINSIGAEELKEDYDLVLGTTFTPEQQQDIVNRIIDEFEPPQSILNEIHKALGNSKYIKFSDLSNVISELRIVEPFLYGHLPL